MIPGLGESLDVGGRQGNERSNPEHQHCRKRTSVVHCPALSDPVNSFFFPINSEKVQKQLRFFSVHFFSLRNTV